jgi:hypothetical protein
MFRAMGVLFFILIVIGLSLHLKGDTWVALTFYTGCVAILVGIVIKMIRRYWY